MRNDDGARRLKIEQRTDSTIVAKEARLSAGLTGLNKADAGGSNAAGQLGKMDEYLVFDAGERKSSVRRSETSQASRDSSSKTKKQEKTLQSGVARITKRKTLLAVDADACKETPKCAVPWNVWN